ncbi:hypothetical protein ACS0Y3_15350 [Burkholderia gladioli]|uniref:hypothetical protein n=1 Tax=Burkholderia gladioli TaxID=28095 RepID=UPI003F7AEB79
MKLRWRVRGQTSETYGAWRTLDERIKLKTAFSGPLGVAGITASARDLVRVGLAVHAIERALPAALSTNRPVEFDVHLKLEDPERWRGAALQALEALLGFQGDAVWHWKMEGGARVLAGLQDAGASLDQRPIDYVTLFSGGLDSTCGIAGAKQEATRTQLVSHYSRQKSKQRILANSLGYAPPTQIRIAGLTGRGRAFFYRSFYFLCLAAAVASSYGVQRVVQYENGVLATAVPPAPAYFMTRHAHPTIHRMAGKLFAAVLGGDWRIDNPFLYRTKGECVRDLRGLLTPESAALVISQTETCWYQYSNQLAAKRSKPNGVPCGVCVPCIVRRSAVQQQEGYYDLNDPEVRSDPILGRDFDAYKSLVARIHDSNGSARMLLEFPGYVSDLMRGPDPTLSRDDLIKLFQHFAAEFNDAFPFNI